MLGTRCLGLVQWDDPEGWDGEGSCGGGTNLSFRNLLHQLSSSHNSRLCACACVCVFSWQIVMFKIMFKTKTISLATINVVWSSAFKKNDLFLFPLFHLLSPQSLAIWFPPNYFNVLLRSLTSVSFPSNTIQALLTIPFNVSPPRGYWDADFSHLLLTFEHLTELKWRNDLSS